ncbi:MAG: amidohydrolase [Eggerthellaceae bacterium]|nr:amidohydrolase [Eggerthellaceae bacterium]
MSEESHCRADYALQSNAVFTGLTDQTAPLDVAVKDDRIVWVGPPDDISLKVDLDDRGPGIVDLQDLFVMPGFHDAHLHFFHSALYSSPLADQYCGKNEQDAVSHLSKLAQRRPKGSWLLTQGWRAAVWDPPVTPTKASLDEAYPVTPCAMYSGDAHTLWLNTCAMERLGITRDSTPPAGGSYDLDENGELTGIVREAAAMEQMARIVGEFSEEELLDAYRGFLAKLASLGITSVCDLSLMALPGSDFVRDDLFSILEKNGELTCRINMFPTLQKDKERLSRLQQDLHSPLLRAQGYKQFFDGVSSQHTAWIKDPYTNAYFDGDCGRPTIDPDLMDYLVEKAVLEGQAVRIHTIGDEAIHEALDIFERHPCKDPSKRYVLEHLENFQPDDLGRLAELGVIASVQPRHITLDPGGPERDLGDERIRYMWPFRTLINAGTTLAFGTDSPVTGPDPLAALYAALTRRDPMTLEPEGGWISDECITMPEALRAYTYGSACAAQRGCELGILAPGRYADIIVLDHNLIECDPEELLSTTVLKTIVGGAEVYSILN